MVAGHADARIHGDGAVRADDYGVEVKLGDLGQVVGELGDAEQYVAQRGFSPRRSATGPSL